MSIRIILLTIRPEHAAGIYAGKKRAELRKSLPRDGVSLVFLYETGSAAGVTGAFIVKRAARLQIEELVAQARDLGVPSERSRKYFEGRDLGWLLEVGKAVRFDPPVALAELRTVNHHLAPPQVFTYLPSSEASTQVLLARFRHALITQGSIRLRKLRSSDEKAVFNNLVMATVPNSYSDIGSKFLDQIMDEYQTSGAAFSTERKRVLRVFCGPTLIGFTVVTMKSYGAWKSGPTVLLPEFRGLGLGRALRRAVDRYAVRLGCWRVFCTAPANRTGIVKYLADSGLEIQARLHRHLSEHRDEYVMSKQLGPAPRARGTLGTPKRTRNVRWTGKVVPHSPDGRRAMAYFVAWTGCWYFDPPRRFMASLRDGLNAGLSFSDVEAKGKELWAALSPRRVPRAAIVCTGKRSKMIKLNIVSDADDGAAVGRVLRAVLQGHPEARRFYCTVPLAAVRTVDALRAAGFRPEGILTEMFHAGIDHLCLGRSAFVAG